MAFNPVSADGTTQIITRGSGRVFIAELDSEERPLGFKYVGESPSFSFTTATETTDAVQSVDGAVPTDIIDEVNTYSISAGLTIRNLSTENMQRFFLGEVSTIPVAASAVTGEVQYASKNSWIQLGSTDANPVGVSAVNKTGFTLKTGASGSTTDVNANNYTLDAENGAVFIKAAAISGSTDSARFEIGYTPVAGSKTVINVPVAPENKKYALRYYEDQNLAKEQWNIFIPVCQTFPEGTYEVKSRTDTTSLPLTLTILNPTGKSDNMYLEKVTA